MMDPELKQALAGLEGRLIRLDERLDTTDTKLESLRHHLDERLEATVTKLLTWFHDHALTNEI
jgi:hypothetical protein